jgi:hypothetical protein
MLKLLIAAVTATVLLSTLVETAQDNDESTRIGFDSTKWGPHVWLHLHLMALNQPTEFGQSCRQFELYLYSLQKSLPCKQCRDEFGVILGVIPPRKFVKYGRIGAVAYMYLIHCIVSNRIKGVTKCQVKFLEKEPELLKTYCLPGYDIDKEIEYLTKAANTTNMQLKINAALIHWDEYVNDDDDN